MRLSERGKVFKKYDAGHFMRLYAYCNLVFFFFFCQTDQLHEYYHVKKTLKDQFYRFNFSSSCFMLHSTFNDDYPILYSLRKSMWNV